jgi:hypothetical protein
MKTLTILQKLNGTKKNAVYMSIMMMGNGGIIAQMVLGIKNMQDFMHSKGCEPSFIPFRNLDRRAVYKKVSFEVFSRFVSSGSNLDWTGVRSLFRNIITTQNLGYT